MKNLIFAGIFALLCFSSCEDDQATIRIKNSVQNVKLTNIRFGKVYIGHSLLPGQSEDYTISEEVNDITFPMREQIEFIMEKGDKQVFLRTQEVFQLNKDETLFVEITDNTKVVNLME